MRVSKVRHVVCECCGDEFGTKSGRARYCPSCSPLVSSALSTLQRRGAARGPERVAAAVEAARKRVHDSRAPRGTRVCAACGDEFVGRADDECCGFCRAEGLDLLHAYSGWTNGWDRKKVEHVEAEDGWRGRPVAGGAHGRRSLFDSGMLADD